MMLLVPLPLLLALLMLLAEKERGSGESDLLIYLRELEEREAKREDRREREFEERERKKERRRMCTPAKLRIVFEENDIRKLVLPSGIPSTLQDLKHDVSRDMIKDGFTNHVMKIIVLGSTAGEEDANIADVIIIIEGTEVSSALPKLIMVVGLDQARPKNQPQAGLCSPVQGVQPTASSVH
ncbi:hypothetical protein DPX16_23686 [Anabarilius grahami]|uniref:Uncharacterized protein n=1 Tax=Anabarilius grahami TaxID=495550 RepID=A0A3N0YHY6_ANAGA|nr:hypothetical protein DPX16_23686 [Anabarilius grahami]